MKIYPYFDSRYAPCSILLVKEHGNPYNDADTVLIQTDWDFPGVASYIGWTPCTECEMTDGTVDCNHRTATDMISEAYDYIRDHAEELFDDPGYFA